MKKYLKFIIPIFIFFIGFSVNAVGIVYLTCDNNGCAVINRCDNQYFCSSDVMNVNEIQFNFDNQNFDIDNTYNFNLNFTTTSPANYGTPNLYDCNLGINGSFVTATRNSGRTGYECGSSRCDASFVSSMTYTMTQSLTDVPSFIRCQMNTSRYSWTQFTYSSNFNKGSVITAINQNGNNQIQTANNNAQHNNANRDSNTNRILSGITGIGNTIVEGVVSGINSAKNFILNSLSTINSTLGDVITGLTTGFGNVVNKLGEIGSAISNKIGEMIGTQEVCTVFLSTNDAVVTNGVVNLLPGKLNSNGQIDDIPSSLTTDFIDIRQVEYPTKFYYYSNYQFQTNFLCTYNDQKQLKDCYELTDIDSVFNLEITPRVNTAFVRYSFPKTNNSGYITRFSGNCHNTGLASIFNKISKFFTNFFNNALGLDRIGTILNNHRNILDNSAFDSLSDFIHSPISFIHSLESSSCTGLTLTVFNQNITLPSGCIFWSREDVSSFRDFWNLLFGGLLIYRMGYRLFKALNDSVDPTKDDLGGLEI